MPFGEYEDFEDCVAKNQDKESPEGYCATIQAEIEGRQYQAMETPALPVAVLAPYEGIFTNVTRAADGTVRWKATVSDDGVDRYATRMTTDLHEDFIRNWKAGEPTFLTLAHFNQLARIGDVTAMYRQGRKLKAEGTFFTNSDDSLIKQLATAAADSALAESKALPSARAIKVSIGFEPRASDAEDLGVIAYTKGRLPEIAMTTHAANSRTDMGASEEQQRALDPDFMEEDAGTIVGPDLAKQVRDQYDALAEQRAGEEADPQALLYRADATAVAEPEAPAEPGPETSTDPVVNEEPEVATGSDSSTTTEAAEPEPTLEPEPPADEPTPEPEPTEEQRAGRKIQGAKLKEMQGAVAQMQTGMEALSGILAWAAGDDGEDRAVADDFRAELIARFSETNAAATDNIAEVVKVRWMELTGNESISEVLDYQAMQQYLCTLIYTLQDLVLANLEPSDDMMGGMTMEQRLSNIDNAIREFTSLVSGIVSSYFSNGRSDNTAMDDIKPTGAEDTASLKPAGESRSDRDLSRFDEMTQQMRQVIETGDRQKVQEFLSSEFASVLEETVPPGDDVEPEPDVNEERMAAIEMGQAAIMRTLEDILKGIANRPAEPEYVTPVPRRRGFTRPPAPTEKPAQRSVVPKGEEKFSIRAVAERGIVNVDSYP